MIFFNFNVQLFEPEVRTRILTNINYDITIILLIDIN